MADAAVTVTMLPAATRLVVRAGGEAVTAISGAFGITLPVEACRAASNGSRSALWQGPDEWLLLAPAGEAPALTSWMAEALGANPASIVEVSDRNVAIEISGPKVRDVLSAFNALDLDDAAFPIGMCTRTLFGKAEIVLWRTARDRFRIEVWRSFAPYVLGCLDAAALEFADA